MLQDTPSPTPSLRPMDCALQTERLTLRKPTIPDAVAVARLADDRRVAEQTRRLPHPYRTDDALQFIGQMNNADTVFLIEHDGMPIGMVGLDWRRPEEPELGYWLGVAHWGQGFATEAARAAIDFAFEEFAIDRVLSAARVANPASRNVLEKCGFQWSGVELHRFKALGSSTPVDCFRLSRGVWSSLKSWSRATRRDV